MKDNLLYRKDKLYVLNKNELRAILIQKIYEHSIVDHLDIQRMKILVQRNYYWLKMKKLIERYIKNYQTYSRAKAWKNKYNRLLQSLLILFRLWEDIAIDFITEILKNKDCNAVLIIINRLIKIKHYIICKAEEKRTSTE